MWRISSPSIQREAINICPPDAGKSSLANKCIGATALPTLSLPSLILARLNAVGMASAYFGFAFGLVKAMITYTAALDQFKGVFANDIFGICLWLRW